LQSGDPNAQQELFASLSPGIQFYLARQLQTHQLEGKVRQTFAIVVSALKSEGPQDQESVMKVVHRIVLQQALAYGNAEMQWGEPNSQGSDLVLENEDPFHAEDIDRILLALKGLPPSGREALHRFYLHGQNEELICQEMKVSKAEFLVWKSNLRANVTGWPNIVNATAQSAQAPARRK